jgi:hypothetical protein
VSIFVDPSSNFHPYECDGPGKCPHCDKTVSDQHDPETCELCCDDGGQP